MIFDTHTHTYFDAIASDQDTIIAEMRASRVAYATQIGCDIKTSRQAIEYARRYPEYFATVGIHPMDGSEDIATGLSELQRLADDFREDIVGIGETGLDYSYPNVGDREKRIQRKFFEGQIIIAKECKLPLVIHSRGASEDTLAILRDMRPERFVLHCYSEDRDFAETIMGDFAEGGYFGLSGLLTYRKNTAVQDAARILPLDRILVETDAPFLAPQAMRGQVNHPAYVSHTLEYLTALRMESPQVVEDTIFKNSLRFYGIVEEKKA